MHRREVLVGASVGITTGLTGCLFGDDDGSADREALAEYVTFDHHFEAVTVGYDMQVSLENQTDRDIGVYVDPAFYIDEEEVSSGSRSTGLDAEGTAELTIPLFIDEDDADAITHYELTIQVYDGPETLVEYEAEFEDFQDRVEA